MSSRCRIKHNVFGMQGDANLSIVMITTITVISVATHQSSVKCSLTLSRRDLNASCSGCLPKFFLGFFKFQYMLLEKKSYLLDFSFRLNAIKFGKLLMNWFIREKMFTYCYNKFRPLSRMHYVKCSVNSLLLT